MIKAIIFDMDGVLIDSEKLKFEQWKKILRRDIDESFFKKECSGKVRGEVCDKLIKKYDLPFSVEELVKIKRKSNIDFYTKENLVPILPAINFLKRIYGKYRIALASSQNMDFIHIALESLDITKYFDGNIFSALDLVENAKPAPDIYLHTAEKINLKPEDCVAIEDTEVGVLSAKAAGMHCIAVPNEFTKEQDFSKADLVVDSLDEVNIDELKWT